MTLAEEVLSRPYPSYHKPLETAKLWLRDGDHKSDALELLTALRKRYAHILAIGNELVLAYLENDRSAEAMTELGRLDHQFQEEVDEETRCRWGSLYKREGESAGRLRIGSQPRVGSSKLRRSTSAATPSVMATIPASTRRRCCCC